MTLRNTSKALGKVMPYKLETCSTCLINHHAMKTYGGVKVQLQTFRYKTEMSNQLQIPGALMFDKKLKGPVPIRCSPRASLDAVQNFCLLGSTPILWPVIYLLY